MSGGDLQVTFAPEDKTVTFPANWLAALVYDRDRTHQLGWLSPGITTWDGGFAAPAGNWTQVHESPAAKLTDGPTEPSSLLKVADLFGYVRETNYYGP